MSGIPAGAGSLLGKRLGKYEILALLALGGTAEIYLARIGGTNGFEKYVVVKCLHDHLADDIEFVKMFLDEARLAAHLDHSNIVQTFELGEHENRYYMVMEFLAGLSLAMVVRRAGERLPNARLPVPIILNIIAQSCAGLHYAHERVINGKQLNIVHRDISPQNLVVSFEGVVKVVDFGIAKAEQRETHTRSGTIKGKFAYMSPEQCVANNVDRRTDVFALGVITHELLTGKRLFKRPSPYDTYQAVIECKVLPPSKMNREIDPELDAVIMKSLAKDKVNRYPTAEAFGDALLSYLHHRGIASSGNEVSRFFDTTFNQEIEEHGARMRELISGREIGVNGWDEEDEKPDSQDDKAGKGNATVDVKLGASGRAKAASNKGDEASMVLETRDLEMMPADRPSTASLDDVIGDLQDDPAADPDADASDMPADRTRIEANPLDLIAELAKTSAQADAAKVTKQSAPLARSQPPGAPVVMPIAGPPSGALALPDPPASPAGSLKFPNLSNLPTMIADLEEDSKAGSEPESEPTSMAPANMLPSRRQPLPHVSDSPEIAAAAAAAVVPMVATPGPMPAYSSTPPPAMAPAPVIPLGPNGYPVLPSGAAALANGAAALANGHFNNVGAPNVAYAGHAGGAPGGFDPAHAAHLMSPVGDQFPQMDWDAAAAMPAKAIPRWLLAVLFSGALLGALLLTVLIARALRHH